MELSKTIALTAILFIIILILTSGRSLGQNTPRPTNTPPKANEATFQRSSQTAPRPAGTERAPAKKKKTAQAEGPQCVYKPVMTEHDMAACRAAGRK